MGLSQLIRSFDNFQQRHPVVGFPLAVIKKFGDDHGAYQAALMTYYGFLSLFPLLLVLVTILQLWFHNNPALRQDVASSIGHYFPLLSDQMQRNIHGMGSNGWVLAGGILLTIYGARGGADALRYALDTIWEIPMKKRAGFPRNILDSFAIMGCAGVGFLATVAVSAFSSALGHATWVKIVVNILGFLIVAGVLGVVFRIATVGRVPFRAMFVGMSIAAGGIQLLLTFGGLLLKHQLKNLDSLYGTFAVVLGLLFWIYLIAQIIVYAAEIDAVRYLKRWPRKL